VRGYFPLEIGEAEPFDVVVALATLEHIPTEDMPGFASACFRQVRSGGKVVLTVPSPVVDLILQVERRLHLAVAPGFDQHHGFNPSQTRPLFEEAGFTIVRHQRFQLGLNNLFVFAKP
jgi:2-polyprenyl-3-methyl-5-hydroxy-6-metoxy-1,4-benzoquinol methylase